MAKLQRSGLEVLKLHSVAALRPSMAQLFVEEIHTGIPSLTVEPIEHHWAAALA